MSYDQEELHEGHDYHGLDDYPDDKEFTIDDLNELIKAEEEQLEIENKRSSKKGIGGRPRSSNGRGQGKPAIPDWMLKQFKPINTDCYIKYLELEESYK